MLKFKKISAIVSIIVGIGFIAIGGSDIQLGFGLVLIFGGIANL